MIPSPGSKGQTYYEKQKQRKRFRRRAGIEPIIGHLKDDHRMRRNFLSGELGDAVNCLLAGAAFNLVKRLNQLKMLPVMVVLMLIQLAMAFFDACVERLDRVTLPTTHQRRTAMEAI